MQLNYFMFSVLFGVTVVWFGLTVWYTVARFLAPDLVTVAFARMMLPGTSRTFIICLTTILSWYAAHYFGYTTIWWYDVPTL